MTQTPQWLDAARETFGRHFAGPVYVPGEQEYESARLPWRRNLDPKPAVVAEATTVEDVRTAVRVAGEVDAPFAVQATGHGAVVPADGGILLKTSRMSDVRVDPARQVATVGPGAIWDPVIDLADGEGLAPVSGGLPWVGVTGYTLGGGTGWLSRKYGFAADSVLRAEVVTADGTLRTATEDTNPELFWALRGGSGNFGVVVALEFSLYPVSQVYAGMLHFPVEKAGDLLNRYGDWALGEPDEMNTGLVLLRMPDIEQVPPPVRGKRVVSLRACYLGEQDEAESLLKPLREAGGEPLMGGFGSMSYGGVRRLTGPPPPPRAACEHLDLFDTLDKEVVDVVIDAAGERADETESPVSVIEVRHWGGAMARAPENASPVGHRDADFSVVIESDLGDNTDAGYVENYMGGLARRLRPYATGGSFLNFLNDPGKTETAFSASNWQRLREVKKIYDPSNFFRCNHNIPPAP